MARGAARHKRHPKAARAPMPTDTVVISVPAVTSAPDDYAVKDSEEFELVSVCADFNGTGAAGSFLPTLIVLDPGGNRVCEIPSSEVAAGGSATVTWFPDGEEATVTPAPSPNPLGTLFAWYDFSDASSLTLDGAGNIAAATDKTGLGHDLSQPTASKRPTPTTVNGLGAAQFDRAVFTSLFTSQFLTSIAQPMTVACVFTIDNAQAVNRYPGVYGKVGPNNALFLFYGDSAGVITSQVQTGSGPTFGLAIPCTQQQVTSIFDGASSAIRLNQAQHNGAMNIEPCTSIRVGATVDPSIPGEDDFLTGKVCELLFYEGHLTGSQLAATESYLKAKWATP